MTSFKDEVLRSKYIRLLWYIRQKQLNYFIRRITLHLYKAVVSGNLGEVERLIADETIVDVQDNDDTVLLEAIVNSHNGIAEALLTIESIKIDIEDNDKETPLHYAAAIGITQHYY